DAFPLLGQRLANEGTLPDGLTPEIFARLRRDAETQARKDHPNPATPEVTLEEIYGYLTKTFGGRSADELAAVEVEFERSITVPDLEVVALARLAQQRFGTRVALVSDTYFSVEQLQRLLDREAFHDVRFDVVLTSSTRGTGKGQQLFEELLAQVDVAPEKILHVGDHHVSDVTSPQRFGIRTVHYHKFVGDLARILDREIGVKEGHIYRKNPRLHPLLGDHGMTALRAKAATRFVCDDVAPDLVPYWQFGASILGPIFSGFAEWVGQRAEALGADVVHCFMREGEFLSRLVNEAGAGPKAQPLWISRRVCTDASFDKVDYDELKRASFRRRPMTVAEFISRISLDVDDVPGAADIAALRMDDPDIGKPLMRRIAANDGLRERIATWSAARRRELVAHLERSLGGFDQASVFVDLGWGATIQTQIDRVLRLEGIDMETTGLYLVTTESVVERMFEGIRAEGFLGSAGTPDVIGRWVMRSPEVLEQVCMPGLGSLVAFGEAGNTVHGRIAASPEQQAQRDAVQRGVLGFQDFWRRQRDLLPEPGRSLAGAVPYLQAVLLRLVIEPMPSEAALFARWLHDENMGSEDAETVVVDDLGQFAAHMTPTQFLDIPMTRVYWPFGLAALYNPPLAAAAATVASDLVPASAFASSEALSIGIDVRTTTAGTFERVHDIESRSNVNGLRFFKSEFLEPTRTMQLVMGEKPGFLRIDGFRLVMELDDGSTHRVTWVTPAELAQLEVARGLRLGGNLVYSAPASPAISYTLPEGAADAWRVDVELAFAFLEGAMMGRTDLAKEVARKAGRVAMRRPRRLLGG
ncbi:MAG TPA: hypothetical protein VF230_17130, partial [Acidimicrobiales bacterium]